MKKEIEDALVNLLKNEENEITYQRLCKLLDFYTYVFMSQQIKSDNLFDYDPITCKPKKEQIRLKSELEEKINQTLVYFWGRVTEKFDKITKAFRFFDLQSVIDNSITD